MKKILLLAAFVAQTTYAQTTNQTMQVSATLNPVCSLQAQNMIIGIFTPKLEGFISTTSNISVICTRETNYTIRLSYRDSNNGNTGNSNNLNTASRNADEGRILSGTKKGETLLYDLYNDSSYTNIMRDDQGQIVGVGTGQIQNYTLYSRLKNNQFVAEDIYINNLVVDIIY